MIIFPFGTYSITSLRMYTKELYILEKNNHISENVWVTKVFLAFSQISKSQLFKAALKLNFICLFLSFIASQKITLHIDTPCIKNLELLYSFGSYFLSGRTVGGRGGGGKNPQKLPYLSYEWPLTFFSFSSSILFVLNIAISKETFHNSTFTDFPNFMGNPEQSCTNDHHKSNPLVED